MSKQTASKAYKAKMKLIEKRMQTIRKLLDQHIEPGKEAHYGHLGDLGHIEELMHRVEAFLKNEDIED